MTQPNTTIPLPYYSKRNGPLCLCSRPYGLSCEIYPSSKEEIVTKWYLNGSGAVSSNPRFEFLMNPNLSQQDAVFWLKNKSNHAILKDSSATCIENSGARIEKIQMVNSLIRVVVWPNVRAVKNFLSWLLFHPSFVWLSLLACLLASCEAHLRRKKFEFWDRNVQSSCC